MAHFKPYDKEYRTQGRVIHGENVYKSRVNISPTIRNYAGGKLYPDYFEDGQTPPPPGFMQDNPSIYSNGLIQNPTNQQKLVDASTFKSFRGVSATETVCENPWRRRTEPRFTPQDQLLGAVSNGPPVRSHKSSGRSEQANDEHRVTHSSEIDGRNVISNQPVDLIISNLDPTIEPKELKRLLKNMFKEYAMILSLNITVQNDGAPIANIKVNGQREAQFTISQLHRKRLGHKRISISYAESASPFPEELKAMVVELLQEVPHKCMPLFQFINLLESRYNCTVSVSEVNKLKDVCNITHYLGSRIISLNQDMKSSPPPNLATTFVQYCTTHCPNGIQSRGWCELNMIETPNIKMSLTLFANKLVTLLKLHMGVMHLLSFQACYEQEFHEPLPVYDGGVPLEHLVTCVPRVEISFVGLNKNIKVIRYVEEKAVEREELSKTVAPQLAPQLSLLCRELVDLLKSQDKCQLLMSKFIPAYHHHFGRQCRVADYGYTKLVDLIESIPHIIQILGDGAGRTITLCHSVQMRRFTSDLLRVLKVQPAKQVTVTDFPSAYEKVINKPFNAVEYGLCTFEDLLQKVSENNVTVYQNESGEYVISVPKREQTSEEITKTKQFASEVIDLLRHSPHYTIYFNKFIPAYHHHFGHQCKVSYYGFTKLIELFEAIPHIVKIEELPNGERTVRLTHLQALKVLGAQIVQLIKSSPHSSLPLIDLPKTYLAEYGYPLKPSLYDCHSISEIITQLSDYVQINNSNTGISLIAIDVDTVPDVLRIRCWALLLKSPHYMNLTTFRYQYQCRYNSNFTMDGLLQIGNAILVSQNNELNYISLTTLYILAAELYHIICNNDGIALYSSLEKLYQDYYKKELKLSSYQIFSVDDFYNHFNLIFFIRYRKEKSVVVLNRNLAEHFIPLPSSIFKSEEAVEKRNGPNNWPAPPSPEIKSKNFKRLCPSKSDTAPLVTSGGSPWNLWSKKSPFDNLLNLSIPMPIVQNPTLLSNPDLLISPARQLLSPLEYLWSAISSPDPTEVPKPDKLIFKGGIADDTADSGVNIKLDNSPSDNESEAGSSAKKCKSDRSPFAKFLNFNN